MVKISFGLSLLALIAIFVYQMIDSQSQNQAIDQTINQQIKLAAEVNQLSQLSLAYQPTPSIGQATPKKPTEIKSPAIGITPSNAAISEPNEKSKQFSDLDIKLLAIAEIGQSKIASIRYENNRDFYQNNQNITPEIKLSEISRDYVLVDYQNKSYRLEVSGEKFHPSEFELVQKPQQVVKTQLLRFQQMVQQDPYALVGVIGIKNYQKSGIKGFELKANIDKKLFNELGLQDGDVLIAINQMDITNGMYLQQIYDDLITKKQFVIKVVRQGRPFEYLLNLS